MGKDIRIHFDILQLARSPNTVLDKMILSNCTSIITEARQLVLQLYPPVHDQLTAHR
jgi:hypothetical protein